MVTLLSLRGKHLIIIMPVRKRYFIMAVSSGYTHVGVTRKEISIYYAGSRGRETSAIPRNAPLYCAKTITPIADATPVLHHHEANIARLRHQG